MKSVAYKRLRRGISVWSWVVYKLGVGCPMNFSVFLWRCLVRRVHDVFEERKILVQEVINVISLDKT